MRNDPETLKASVVRVTTGTVKIKVLTVDGRQMTLAVFRQLPRLDAALWRTHDLRGTAEPWGTVNYCADCSPGMKAADGQIVGNRRNPSHLHLVWRSGPRLYRSTLLEPGMLPIHTIDLVRGDSYGWEADGRDVWWEESDLDEASARYGELLKLDRLFIAV